MFSEFSPTHPYLFPSPLRGEVFNRVHQDRGAQVTLVSPDGVRLFQTYTNIAILQRPAFPSHGVRSSNMSSTCNSHWFPSPYGVRSFQTKEGGYARWRLRLEVSVPSRGEVISNPVPETPCPTGGSIAGLRRTVVTDTVSSLLYLKNLYKRLDFGCG